MAPRCESTGAGPVVELKRSSSLHQARSKSLPLNKACRGVLERTASWPRLPSSQFASGVAFVTKPGALAEEILSLSDRIAMAPAPARPILKRGHRKERGASGPKRSVRFALSVLVWEAAESDDTEEMNRLLEKIPPRRLGSLKSSLRQEGIFPGLDEGEIDLNMSNHEGVSLLHLCCMNGNLELVRRLLDLGASPDPVDVDGWTPVHVATSIGRLDIVFELIGAGATIPGLEESETMEGLNGVTEDQKVIDAIEEFRHQIGTAV